MNSVTTFTLFQHRKVVEKKVVVGRCFTIRAFVNPTHYAYGVIAGTENSHFRLVLLSDGHVAFFMGGVGDPHVPALTTPAPIPCNQFTSIAVIYDNNQLLLYVDGKKVGTTLTSSAVDTKHNINNNNKKIFGVRIGSKYPDGAKNPKEAEDFYPGTIANASYHNEALTETQIVDDSFGILTSQGAGPYGNQSSGSVAFNDMETTATKICFGVDTSSPEYRIRNVQCWWGTQASPLHGPTSTITFNATPMYFPTDGSNFASGEYINAMTVYWSGDYIQAIWAQIYLIQQLLGQLQVFPNH